MYKLRSCLSGIIGVIVFFLGFGILEVPFSKGGWFLVIPGLLVIYIAFVIAFEKEEK